ncbi:MAG: hypothetical protein IPO91_08600 [Chloroflexi bacterium]|nr:hypothetical protein [Chloroflexota bacterium]
MARRSADEPKHSNAWMLFLIPVGLCVFSVCGTWLIPDMVGLAIATVTRYGSAELVYAGSNEYGSEEWVSAAYIFWTSAPLQEVEAHYEQFFDMQTVEWYGFVSRYLKQDYPSMSLIWLPFAYDTDFSVDVRFVYASDYRHRTPCCNYRNIDRYLDPVPHYGTLIILRHTAFRP